MGVFNDAARVMADAKKRGTLNRHYPMEPSWEGPARWRVSPDVLERLILEADLDSYSFRLPMTRTATPMLYGYPLVEDDQAPEGTLTLEPIPSEK